MPRCRTSHARPDRRAPAEIVTRGADHRFARHRSARACRRFDHLDPRRRGLQRDSRQGRDASAAIRTLSESVSQDHPGGARADLRIGGRGSWASRLESTGEPTRPTRRPSTIRRRPSSRSKPCARSRGPRASATMSGPSWARRISPSCCARFPEPTSSSATATRAGLHNPRLRLQRRRHRPRRRLFYRTGEADAAGVNVSGVPGEWQARIPCEQGNLQRIWRFWLFSATKRIGKANCLNDWAQFP